MNAQKGFTLIELMIVVAIIGILAAIAIPQYQNYVGRSNIASAVQSVGSNKTGVESFVMEYGAFPDGTSDEAAATTGENPTPYVPAQKPADLGIVNPTYGTITLKQGTGAGAGAIILKFNSGNPGIKDKHVEWVRSTDGTWTCESDADAKFVGKSCTHKATLTVTP
ncbi:pilin [Acinetobacter sp. 10FS3-1]|uniref:pilin n=1 Tax=Acinetobacter sp. 10FS3-1 TaxID=2563897 RepID=UPI00157CE80E|nr:pilin [Acinetobacter sp. 10FS3-1]QKQ70949.1 pilin [Acinetobacter sp. 10FS3-1]